jgi:DNA-binding response OmpR family regulator
VSAARILVVDDEPQVRKLLGASLSKAGFIVGLAADGLEALKLVREAVPDLVITDVSMPNMNGLELSRRLRSSHKTAGVPILMLSAAKQEQDVLAGYAEGADDYVGKPVELTILRAKIDRLLGRAAAAAPAAVADTGEAVLFMHGKGGVGATTLAVNTAVAMTSRSPERVGILDLNLTFADSDVMLDLRETRALSELSQLRGEIDDASFADFVSSHRSGVRLVMSNRTPEQAELVTLPAVQLAINWLRRKCEYVFIDLPANFSEQTLLAVDCARLVCLVTTARLASLKATRECMEVLEKLGHPRESTVLVLNQTEPQSINVQRVTSFFQRPPDVVIGLVELFDQAADTGRPLVLQHPKSDAAAEIRGLAEHIADLLYEGPRV